MTMRTSSLSAVLCALSCALAASALSVPDTMRAVRVKPLVKCTKPAFACFETGATRDRGSNLQRRKTLASPLCAVLVTRSDGQDTETDPGRGADSAKRQLRQPERR